LDGRQAGCKEARQFVPQIFFRYPEQGKKTDKLLLNKNDIGDVF